MDLGLAGKVVVCTGAAGGIGLPTAELFAAEGARVVCVDRDAMAADDVVAGLPGHGHVPLGADLGDRGSAEAVVRAAVEATGRIDVLAHLAAVLRPAPVAAVSEELWDEHLAVNLTATFFLARAAAQRLRAQGSGGRIVLITSGAWLSGGLPDRLPYATTKGAVTTMLRGLAKEYGPDGITVNAVAPGLVDTGMMRAGLPEGARGALEAATPLRRFADPVEIAAVIVFLASARASFVSGASVNVSGGHTLY